VSRKTIVVGIKTKIATHAITSSSCTEHTLRIMD